MWVQRFGRTHLVDGLVEPVLGLSEVIKCIIVLAHPLVADGLAPLTLCPQFDMSRGLEEASAAEAAAAAASAKAPRVEIARNQLLEYLGTLSPFSEREGCPPNLLIAHLFGHISLLFCVFFT